MIEKNTHLQPPRNIYFWGWFFSYVSILFATWSVGSHFFEDPSFTSCDTPSFYAKCESQTIYDLRCFEHVKKSTYTMRTDENERMERCHWVSRPYFFNNCRFRLRNYKNYLLKPELRDLSKEKSRKSMWNVRVLMFFSCGKASSMEICCKYNKICDFTVFCCPRAQKSRYRNMFSQHWRSSC